MISQPHDAFFKKCLTHPKIAFEYLSTYLPDYLLEICDLATLELMPDTFISEDLRSLHIDIVYRMRDKLKTTYIYIVIEHQSTGQIRMSFRMVRYSIAIMQRHLELDHTTVPLVVPMLFYHGAQKPYAYEMNWLKLFAYPKQAALLYTNDFPLTDTSTLTDQMILEKKLLALLELLQKYIYDRDMMNKIKPLEGVFAKTKVPHELAVAACYYIINAADLDIDNSTILKQLNFLFPQQQGDIMTIAEKLRLEGEAKGLLEGIQLVAKNLLSLKMPIPEITQATGLSAEDIAKLTHAK